MTDNREALPLPWSYVYRYADGSLHMNGGVEVNGSRPTEAIGVYLAPDVEKIVSALRSAASWAAVPVAWRWQEKGWGDHWIYNPEPEWLAQQHNIVKQPLYATPVAAGVRDDLLTACLNILPYLRWTIGPESPSHHPTMPSAVAAFEAALASAGADKSDNPVQGAESASGAHVAGRTAGANPATGAIPSTDQRREEIARAALDAIEQSCWSLRCEDVPTGAGDADVVWHVVSHHMAKPHDRVEGIGNTPLKAIQNALDGGERG